MQCAVSGPLLINLARLLADPVEKCREGAIMLLHNAAEQLPEPAVMLSALIPAIVARMGDVPVIEASEELRLALIDLVGGPVVVRCGHQLDPYLGLVVQVVCRSLDDPFHKIKKVTYTLQTMHYSLNTHAEACHQAAMYAAYVDEHVKRCYIALELVCETNVGPCGQAGGTAIANLCDQVTSSALGSQHEALLASLLPNLSHQHSRVRAATLTAVDMLVTKVRDVVLWHTLILSLQ